MKSNVRKKLDYYDEDCFKTKFVHNAFNIFNEKLAWESYNSIVITIFLLIMFGQRFTAE